MVHRLIFTFIITQIVGCTPQPASRSRLLEDVSTPTEISGLQVRYGDDGRVILEKFPENSTDKLLSVRSLNLASMSGSTKPNTSLSTLMPLAVAVDLSILRDSNPLDCQGILYATKSQQSLDCKKQTSPTTLAEETQTTRDDEYARSQSGSQDQTNPDEETNDAIDQLYALLGPAEGGYGTTVLFSWSNDPKNAGNFREISYRIVGDVELNATAATSASSGFRFSLDKLNVIAQIGTQLPKFECQGVNYQTPRKCAPYKEPSR